MDKKMPELKIYINTNYSSPFPKSLEKNARRNRDGDRKAQWSHDSDSLSVLRVVLGVVFVGVEGRGGFGWHHR